MKYSGFQFCFGLSLVCHAVGLGLVIYWGQALQQPKLRSEDLPLTVTLIAAPEASTLPPAAVAPVTAPAPPVEIRKPLLPQVKSPDLLPVEEITKPIIPLPKPDVVQPPLVAPASIASAAITPANPAVVGDGSSPQPGLDRITEQAQSGDRARPDYRHNPKPTYPPAARRRHQQGLVLLTVSVTAKGRASRIELKQSSGFPLLDEAALQTVRDWEFEPARIGAIAVESEVEVPVRFQLGN